MLICHAADTASLATWILFGKLLSVATLVAFGEKRCRKNLPLSDTGMKAMRAELAFFDGDDLLSRDVVLIHSEEDTCVITSERGERFEVTRQFEEPASPILVKAFSSDGTFIFRSAMRMGVHNSDDWERIDLAEPYQMCFRCAIVDLSLIHI